MTLKITPTDDKKQEEGTWTRYINVDLKIARTSKPKYVSEIARRMRAFKGKRNNLDAQEVIDETCQALAKHILVGWKNFTINGEEVPYTFENAYDLLKNDDDCREFIIEFADDASNFFKEEVEEIVGKSLTT